MKKLLSGILVTFALILPQMIQGQTTVTVANGTTTNSYVPIYGLYTDNYLRCQTIYPENIMNGVIGNFITKIVYYLSSPASSQTGATFEVKIGTSSMSAFSTATFDNSASLTSVFTGNLNLTNSPVEIEFSEPFLYIGGNLLIEVDCIDYDSYSSCSWYGISSTGGSASGYSSTSVAAVSATKRNFIPKTTFTIYPAEGVCLPPTITNVVVDGTSATITWRENGDASSYAVTLDGANQQIVNNTTTYTFDNLNTITSYTAAVRAICSVGDTSFASSRSFTTPCGVYDTPYFEDFDNITANAFPDCWTSLTGTNYVYNGSSRAHSGTKSLRFAGGTIVTPGFDVSGANELEVYFYMQREGSSSGTMDIGITTDPTSVANVQWTRLTFPTDGTHYEFLQYLTIPNNATTAYVAFKQTGSSSYWFWLDDINIDIAPPCHKATGLTVTGVGSTTATLSWNHSGSQFEIQYRPSGTTTWESTVVNSNPATVTGLNPATNYEFQVRAICDGSYSTWSSSAFEVTACSEIIVTDQISHLENCEESMSNTGLPVCWVQESQSTYYIWNVSEGGYNGKGMYFHGYNGYTSRLISPVFDFSALDRGAQMYLWYNIPQTDDDGYLLNANLKLYYRTSSSAQWTQIPATAMTQSTEDWADIEILLPNSANAATYQIAFLATAANDYAYTNAYIDEIVVESQFSCPRATDVTLDYADATTATVSWTTTATGNATVKYRRSDAEEDDPWIEVQSNSANSVTLTDLTPKTSYDIYVKVACSETDESPYTRHAYTFWTTCYDNAITSYPWTEGFESGLICWSQEVLNGDYEWITQRGDGEPTSHALSNAYAGKKNALFYSPTYVIGNSARLVSPVFDLSDLRNPYLRYAYATTAYDYAGPQQRVLEGSYDNMKLYYRTSATAQWQLLKEYNNATVGWMIDSVALPNTTATYQFSIVATFNGGNGVALDNLKVFRPINSSDDGIDDVSSNLNLSIYPNPTNGNTTISIEGVTGKLNIAVIDINGRTLRSEQVECHDSCVERIDVNGLAKGAYFVKVTGATVNCIRKLIVQ